MTKIKEPENTKNAEKLWIRTYILFVDIMLTESSDVTPEALNDQASRLATLAVRDYLLIFKTHSKSKNVIN